MTKTKRESISINRSILCLGQCVQALCLSYKHIPYRNSKLTRILSEALGGNSRCIIICTIVSTTAQMNYINNRQGFMDMWMGHGGSYRSEKGKLIISNDLESNFYNKEINISDGINRFLWPFILDRNSKELENYKRKFIDLVDEFSNRPVPLLRQDMKLKCPERLSEERVHVDERRGLLQSRLERILAELLEVCLLRLTLEL